jgi:murein DD-endopeptidase MepM/ murein hydrolase activator NlpD
MTDSAPLNVTPPDVIEPAQATGNVVVLELEPGRFATYAHLAPGSLQVKEGERVTRGQSLGNVGNSGNSLGPHLHFHVSDRPEPLAGEGLPFALDSFTLVGRVAAFPPLLSGTPWAASADQPARPVAHEMPLENMVIVFSSPAQARRE